VKKKSFAAKSGKGLQDESGKEIPAFEGMIKIRP